MSIRSVRTFKESRKLSYLAMSVLSTEFLRSRGMLKRYASWLSKLDDRSIKCFMDSHRDEVMPASGRKRAERDLDRPLLDAIDKKAVFAHEAREAQGNGIRVSPALKRRLRELRETPSYKPLPSEEQEEPMLTKKS